MVFPISEIDLNFNNMNNELPSSVINTIRETIYETSLVKPAYVIGNHFTENSQMSLADFGFFSTFREGKTLQSDIETYMSNFKPGIDAFSRQFISNQRMYIKPEYFKALSREFLCRLEYTTYNPFFKTYNGFFVYAVDGSDENIT